MFTLVSWEKQQQAAKWFIHYSGSFMCHFGQCGKKRLFGVRFLYMLFTILLSKNWRIIFKSLLINLANLFTLIISTYTAVIHTLCCFLLDKFLLFSFWGDTKDYLLSYHLFSYVAALTEGLVFLKGTYSPPAFLFRKAHGLEYPTKWYQGKDIRWDGL